MWMLSKIGFVQKVFYHPNVDYPKSVLEQTTVVVTKP